MTMLIIINFLLCFHVCKVAVHKSQLGKGECFAKIFWPRARRIEHMDFATEPTHVVLKRIVLSHSKGID